MNDFKAAFIGYISATLGASALGLIIDLFSALILGGAGALGAWLVNRYMNKKYPKK